MRPASCILLSAIALMCMSGLSAACNDDYNSPSPANARTSAVNTIRVKVPTKALNSHDYHARQVRFRDEIAHVDWSLDLQAVAFRQLQSYGESKKIPSNKLPVSASLLLNATCSVPCEFVEARLVKLTHDGIQAFDFRRFPSNHKDKLHYVHSYLEDNQNEFDAIVCPDCSMTLELDYRKVMDIDLTKAPHEERQTVLSNDFTSK